MVVLDLHGRGQLLLRLPLRIAPGKRRFSGLKLFRVGDQLQCPLPHHVHLGDGIGHKPHGPPVEVVVNCEVHPAEEPVLTLSPGDPGSLGSPEKRLPFLRQKFHEFVVSPVEFPVPFFLPRVGALNGPLGAGIVVHALLDLAVQRMGRSPGRSAEAEHQKNQKGRRSHHIPLPCQS